MIRQPRSFSSSRSLPVGLALIGLSLAPVATPLLTPADARKIVCWNILNYPSASGAAREDDYRTVITALHPDVIYTQEMTGTTSTGMNQFLNNVLNTAFPGEYAAGTWINGDDTDNAIFYRTAVFDFVSADTIDTNLRAIHHFVLRPDGYSATAAELHIYSAHLKAGSSGADQDQRLEETTRWRNRMNLHVAGTHFIAGGDFNIQSSSESAYQKLIGSEADNDGRCFDPINTPGSWNNNSSFAAIHTQSPMYSGNPYGGATGGMDDRFDFQLVSSAMMDNEGLAYVSGTYKAYGNDGNHFNLAINASPTIPEGAAMAAALAEASDHLPVIMTIQLPAKIDVVASMNFGTVFVGAAAVQNLSVGNVAVAPADELTYTVVSPVGFTGGGAFNTNPGFSQNHAITMLTGSAGVKGGTLVVNSDDVDFPVKNVTLSGTVLRHAVPSVAATPVATTDTLDFGSQPIGSFTDGSVFVHNSGFDANQGRLDVYGAALTGPDAGRFSIVGGFAPELLSGTPAEWMIHFDDTGASDNTTYSATLTFDTRDENFPGQTTLADVTWELVAHVMGASGVPGGEAPPVATRLLGNAPNPFSPSTRVAFELAAAGGVRIDIFDVHGRLVRTLVEGDRDAGRYEEAWDGRDDSGRELGSGVYYYRLLTNDRRETRSMTLLR
jgi:endonuclease/exonuclease/phosphatase family metal-dependent hydrolase